MLKKLLLGICTSICCIFLSSQIYAQQKTVTGTITNANGNTPIANATVSVKGTNVAVSSAANGDFSISVPDGKTALTISSVGFDVDEINIAGKSSVKIQLKERTSSLNEVVVTGYTSQKRKEITGAVSVVNVKDMKTIPAGTAEQMLQGQASGVTIIGSGQPGGASSVFVRGITSFGNTVPLIIVDGMQSAPGDMSTLHDLAASDIASIQVLKDAQAAIYGVRGSAGVIIVTTKRGAGKTMFTYDGFVGTQQVLQGNVWNGLDPQGMADLYWLAANNSGQVKPDTAAVCPGCVVSAQYGTGLAPVMPAYIKAGSSSGLTQAGPATNIDLYNNNYNKGPIYLIVPSNPAGTDWFHTLFKPAPILSQTVTAQGGSDKSTYLFSFNYFDQQGTLLATDLKRYAARINTNFAVTNNFRIGENLYAYFKTNPQIGNNQEGNAVNLTAWEQPIIPRFDAGGGSGGTAGAELGNSSNPEANQQRSLGNYNQDVFIQGSLYAEVDFLKHFTAKTLFGGNMVNNYGYYHNYRTYENAENGASNSYGEYSGYNYNFNFTNTISYNNTFAQNHNVKVLVGYEALQYAGRNLSGQRINYFSDNPNYLNLATGANTGQSNNSFGYLTTGTAWLAKIDYAFKDKYLLGLNGRRDGNSVFGPEARFGNFGSVSAGWMVTEEDFMKSVTFINSLKIRGSVGTLGSVANVPQTNQYTLYGGGGGNAYYDVNGSSGSSVNGGFFATNYGNASTGWERDNIIDFGFDATILKNKIDVSFDWYQKKIDGLLFGDQAPAVVGLGATLPQINIGDMQNTGIDLMVTYHTVISNKVTFSVGANIGAYKNLILTIPGSAGFFDVAGTHNTGNQVRNQQGHPYSSFYGYHIIGIYQNDAEVAKLPTEADAAPGRFIYQDANNDGKITDADRVFFGNPNPDFTYGLNISASYKQFDFSTVLYGSQGNQILNYTRYFQDFYPQFQNAKAIPVLTESWLPTRTNTKYPMAENNSYFSTNGVINDFYNENGSYFRCKQMLIGYNFAPDLLKKYGINRARIYIQAANLFTITQYSGLDPEVGIQQGSTGFFGVDYGNYPPSKTYNFGVSLTF